MTRLVPIAVLGVAFFVAALFVQQAVHYSGGSNTSPIQQLDVQGVHHRLGLAKTNSAGKQLTLDDVVVAADSITLYYHVHGLKGISFSQAAQDPRYRTESPTLIHVVVDGIQLIPLDSWTQGAQGGITKQGEFVVRWPGGTPHHLHISVERIEGDLQAKWEVDADL